MPTFTYHALDRNGKASRGSLAADSRVAALDAVARLGLVPVSVGEKEVQSSKFKVESSEQHNAGRRKLSFARGTRLSARQVEAFTRELANLLAAGVPLGRALAILKREAGSAAAKAQWSRVHDEVVGGKPLADALAQWPKSFPPVLVAMVRAGETGGFLDVVLSQIADFRTREAELKGKVKSAMIYPTVLAVLALAVMIFLLTYFIPLFTSMFADLGGALPLLTRIIIGVSHAATHYAPVIVVGIAGIALLLWRALHSDGGRRFVDRALLGVPGLGTVLARFALVRFTRMLGTLLGAGVPLVRALQVAREAVGNQTLADTLTLGLEEVKRGAALSRSLTASPKLFPPSVIEMVAVAEESGRLDQELLRLAQTYEQDLDRRLRMLVALAEPAMLFVMAALIGTIVIGMLLPIFKIQELIK